MDRIELADKVAWSYHGTPYLWGGDDPSGFDCSGYVVEILQSVGIIDRLEDFTANGLFHRFANLSVATPTKGCLVFWGDSILKITHVEFCISETHTLGASGGGSKTLTVQDAHKQNAYIKARPIRPGFVAIVNPFL